MARTATLFLGLISTGLFLVGVLSGFTAVTARERVRRSFTLIAWALVLGVLALVIYDPAHLKSWGCLLGAGLAFLLVTSILRGIQGAASRSLGMDDPFDRSNHDEER